MILNFKKGSQILGKKIADLDAGEPTPQPAALQPHRRWLHQLQPPSPRLLSLLRTGEISL
jgi:hypothetical protein